MCGPGLGTLFTLKTCKTVDQFKRSDSWNDQHFCWNNTHTCKHERKKNKQDRLFCLWKQKCKNKTNERTKRTLRRVRLSYCVCFLNSKCIHKMYIDCVLVAVIMFSIDWVSFRWQWWSNNDNGVDTFEQSIYVCSFCFRFLTITASAAAKITTITTITTSIS